MEKNLIESMGEKYEEFLIDESKYEDMRIAFLFQRAKSKCARYCVR